MEQGTYKLLVALTMPPKHLLSFGKMETPTASFTGKCQQVELLYLRLYGPMREYIWMDSIVGTWRSQKRQVNCVFICNYLTIVTICILYYCVIKSWSFGWFATQSRILRLSFYFMCDSNFAASSYFPCFLFQWLVDKTYLGKYTKSLKSYTYPYLTKQTRRIIAQCNCSALSIVGKCAYSKMFFVPPQVSM